MPYILNKYYPSRDILFFLGEGALISFIILMSSFMFRGGEAFFGEFYVFLSKAITVTIVFQLCLYFFDLYDLRQDLNLPDTATRLTQAFGVGCIILAVFYYISPWITIATSIFWSSYLVICITLLGYRFAYHKILRQKLFVQGIVVIGTGKLAQDIATELEERHNAMYRIVAFVGEDSGNKYNIPVVPSLEEMKSLLSVETIERIIVAPDDRRGATPVRTLLNCKIRGTNIEQGVSFYERITGKILVERVDPSWIIFSDGFVLSRLRYFLKRLMDILLAAPLLLCSLPVLILSAIIIKVESPGPIFYLQERVGLNGKEFRIIKFRSMCNDAEKNGAVWAVENDTRITKFGRFIRKVRIDELPQLWNVLQGEMSLVGPRPERQVFVDDLVNDIPYYNMRHGVKPGVTGWAQVCYPYGATKKDALRKLEYDLFYIKNNSLALDLLVIFYTVKTVLFGKGR